MKLVIQKFVGVVALYVLGAALFYGAGFRHGAHCEPENWISPGLLLARRDWVRLRP